MALKFTDKLKGIDLGKGKESLSEVASSVSKLFDRKNRESTISNVKENIDVEYELENILEPTTQNIVKAVFEPEMKWYLIEQFGVDSFTEAPDGRLLFEYEYSDMESLLSWMLTCRDSVTVLEPETVRNELHRIASNIKMKYEGE